jgi:protein-S-isoprenylcysteine O-methyltransferase Ste14
MLRLAIFVLASALLALTLRGHHAHRFYRYFAFVSLIGLASLNADAWFRDPVSPRQLASWALLACSIVFAEEGFRLLRRVGAPEGGFEDTTRLVTDGVYRYVRHPMYASLIFGGAGAFLKRPSLVALALLLLVGLFSFATARIEESGSVEKFGETYRAYQEKTKWFIPFLV